MILYADNKHLEELKRLFGVYPLNTKTIAEYSNIVGSINDIILNKSLHFGNNSIVEDTTAIINGEQYINSIEICKGNIVSGKLIINIEEQFNELQNGDYIKLISSLAINRNNEIKIFRGTMYGIINNNISDKGLEFFMTPILGKDILSGTMNELRNMGYGDMLSWRSTAVRRFLRYESIEKGASLTPFMHDSCQPELIISS